MYQTNHINLRGHGGPWVIKQTWCELSFLHWPIASSKLREHIPQALNIEEFDGTAWIGVVPFTMTIGDSLGIFTHRFHELNVRTYVNHKGESGVFFFSLDSASRLATELARAAFALPYYNAAIDMKVREDHCVSYTSKRTDDRGVAAELICEYNPVGDVFQATPGTLEHFLTERYCLYTHMLGRILRCDVLHNPWPLQRAAVQISKNSMCSQLPLDTNIAPHALFSTGVAVLTSPPKL